MRCRRITILEDYLDAYLHAAGIGEAKKSPLFRSVLAHRRADGCRHAPDRRLA